MLPTPSADRSDGSLTPLIWLAVIAICAAGAVLRFTNLDRAVYWNDEALTTLRLSGHSDNDFISAVVNGHALTVREFAPYQHVAQSKSLRDVLSVAAAEEPQLAPLHLALSWTWVAAFGDSIAAVRGLSALAGVLAIAAIFWLGFELSGLRWTAAIAAVLFSVSPFHVAYAQEARSYSLWTLMLIVSTATLLSALRRPTVARWGLYTFSIALSLYAHLLSILVIAAHLAYVAAVHGPRRRISKLPALVRMNLVATLAALVLFAPRIALVVQNPQGMSSNLGWLSTDVGHRARLVSWGGGLIRYVADFGWSETDAAQSNAVMLVFVAVGLGISGLISYSLYRALRERPMTEWLMPVLLIGSLILMITADMISGGRQSTISRYLIPGYLGITLILATALGGWLASSRRPQRLLAIASLVLLVASGMVSNLITAQSTYRWTKAALGRVTITVADAVNQEPAALLISDSARASIGNLLALSYRLDADVRLQLVYRADTLIVAPGYTTIFLFEVSDSLRRAVSEQLKVRFELIDERARLWKNVSDSGLVR